MTSRFHFLSSSVVMPCYLFINCAFSHSKNGGLSYKAQSQDEEALVRAAAQLHMIFAKKNANILGMQYGRKYAYISTCYIEMFVNVCVFV